MDKARVRRFTDNDQRIDYPNDDGFSFVTKIQDREINWGVPFPNAERTGGTTGTISRDDRSMK